MTMTPTPLTDDQKKAIYAIRVDVTSRIRDRIFRDEKYQVFCNRGRNPVDALLWEVLRSLWTGDGRHVLNTYNQAAYVQWRDVQWNDFRVKLLEDDAFSKRWAALRTNTTLHGITDAFASVSLGQAAPPDHSSVAWSLVEDAVYGR